jgi:prepilin-type N-terminal cleavage/methylation domain-containing protein
MKKESRQKGFTLLETLVAVSILIIVILGPLSLAIVSMSLSFVSQNQLVASYLGQEGVELVRNRRDNNLIIGANWLQGLSPCSTLNGCYMDAVSSNVTNCGSNCPPLKYNEGSSIPYSYQGGENTIFVRIIKITPLGSDEARIDVIVSWPERKTGTKTTTIQENIFNWKP